MQAPADLFQDLANIEMVGMLNEGFCELHHKVYCPPSEELIRECGKVWRHEQAPNETECSLIVVWTSSRHSHSFIHSLHMCLALGPATHSSIETSVRSLKHHYVALISAPERQFCLSLTAAKADEQMLIWISLIA